MEELDLELIKKKAKAGVFVLTSRTAILQIITFTSTFLLTILLKPEVFGIFFVVSAAVSFLSYFSDIGLAAALVQKKEEITDSDLKTTFTIQLILVLIIISLSFVLSNNIVRFYNLGPSGLWLFRSLLFAFFLSSFKTIPSIILERKLEFKKFVIPQIVETLFFYITVVILAWLGWGITSFTIGVIMRALSGLITIYIIVPWLPRIGIEKNSAKKLLNFGIPFQLNSLLALVKDDLLTVYLGKSLGFTAVGYIGWAKKWSEMPLRLIMDNINKVSFPTFSRLQHHSDQMAKAVEKAIFFVLLLTLPIVFAGIILIEPLVKVIPKYSKWEPAIFSFYLFSLSVILSSVSSLLTNMIQSIGKVKITLRLMIMWTTLTWILIPLFIKIFGFNGVAIAMVLISLTSIVTLIIAKKLIHFSLKKAFKKPLIIGILTSGVMLVSRLLYPVSNVYQIIFVLASGMIIYLICLFWFAKKETISVFK